MNVETISWRRLDLPGHDACRLERAAHGWRVSGAAVFLHELGPACVAYEYLCDDHWNTRSGCVRGWVGEAVVDLRVAHAPDGSWALNGRVVPTVRDCAHLDFGFTPATNLPQLRAMQLSVGDARDLNVAWLDVPAGALELLHQRYERTSDRRFAYAAPRFEYSGVLDVDERGFVRSYPDLWEADP